MILFMLFLYDREDIGWQVRGEVIESSLAQKLCILQRIRGCEQHLEFGCSRDPHDHTLVSRVHVIDQLSSDDLR